MGMEYVGLNRVKALDCRVAVCVPGDARLQYMLELVFHRAQIQCYQSPQQLYAELELGKSYHLIFLDTEFAPKNGIVWGKAIRELLPKVELVYVTHHADWAVDAFQLNALHYILAPYDQESLEEVKRRLKCHQCGSHMLVIDGYQQHIPCRKISYIESVHNNLIVHFTTGRVLKLRGSISGFMQLLDDNFLKINRGIIVNMAAIEKMESESCSVNGMTFMLSRKERANNKRRYQEWMLTDAIQGDQGEDDL